MPHNKKIINRAKRIFESFNAMYFNKLKGPYEVSWHEKNRTMWGKDSLLLTGNVETYKKNLDARLRTDKKVAKYLSHYRLAHIDLKGQSINLPFYKEFRVSDFKVVRTK